MSPVIIRRWTVVALALVASTAGCSSSGPSSDASTNGPSVYGSATVPTTTTAKASARGQCKLRQGQDVIEWVKTPGQPATAQRLGDLDYTDCVHTWDQKTLKAQTSTLPGFCTIVASLTGNPGYNIDAVPARKPKRILGEAGAAC